MKTPPVARALLSLRRFYYVFHATRERDKRNINNTSMKESRWRRAHTNVIIDVGVREKYNYDACEERRRRADALVPFARAATVVCSSRSRANNRSPARARRWKHVRRPRPPLFFSGRFRTHAVYHWPPAERASPSLVPRSRYCVCVARVFILTGTVPVVRARTLSSRSTLAALRSHRITARWSHWTGPRLFLFYFFFVSVAGRTHSHHSLTHAFTYVHTHSAVISLVTR